jgi:hypothetical protein
MSWQRFALALLACACLSKTARAHAPPLANGIRWLDAGGQPRAIVRTNRGLIEQDAKGAFRLLCNDAFDVSLSEIPPVVVTGDGRLLLGTYAAGLVLSTPDRCSFESVAGMFDGVYPIALNAGAQGVVYAAVLPLDGSSAELWRTSDRGSSVESLTSLPGAPSAVEITGSDDSRIYVSTVTAEGNLSFGSLLTSSDAGQNFDEHPIELDASELRVFVLAVAATDPKLLFVRTQSRDGLTPERLLRSDDGGETFDTVLSAPGPLVALAQADGTLWTGSAEGLYRSADDGRTFERVDGNDLTRVTCLAERDGSLYICAYSTGQFGVLSSGDAGGSFDWFLQFPDVRARLDCGADTDEGKLCTDEFADWSAEQGPIPTPAGDAGAAADPIGTAKSTKPRGTEAGCQLVAQGSAPGAVALLGAVAGLWVLRRRGTGREFLPRSGALRARTARRAGRAARPLVISGETRA